MHSDQEMDTGEDPACLDWCYHDVGWARGQGKQTGLHHILMPKLRAV
jgi:hypothetical protein